MGSISDTRLVKGIVLERRLKLDTLPRNLSAGKVAVLSCPIELQQTTRDSEVEISTPEQWEAFIDAEQEILDSKSEKILSSGASIVFCAENVDDRIMHKLVGDGIFILDGLERSGAEDLALSTGANMINHIDDLDEESLGDFESMSIVRVEDSNEPRDRITLEVGNHSKLSTIDVGGGDGVASAEIIRGMYDALRSVCASI